MKKRFLLAAVTLAAFLVALYGPRHLVALRGLDPAQFSDLGFSLYRAGAWVGIPMLTLAAWYGPRRVLRELGWHASPGTGLLVGLACTLPMLLGYAVLFPRTTTAGPALFSALLRGAFWAGLTEETLFRGFLFGQFYRRVKLPWLAVVLVESGIFATGHLYQGHDLLSSLGVLAVTFGGGVWFGWLYKSWQNLWVPIFMHLFMNGWWMLFEVDNSAVGSVGANVFRVMTIGLSVAMTRWHLRRRAPVAQALAVA